MKSFHFPSNYSSSDKLETRIIKINELQNCLINNLKKEFNLIQVEPILIDTNKQVSHRQINFDNKNNGQIYHIISCPEQYLNSVIKKINFNDILGIISIYNYWNRDALIKNNSYINTKVIDFKYKISEDEFNNFELVIKIFEKRLNNILLMTINETNLLSNKNFIKHLQNSHFKISNLNEANKWYSTLNINDFVKELIIQNTIMTFIKNENESIHFSNLKYQDNSFNSETLYYYESIDDFLSLFQVNLYKNDVNHFVHISLNINNLLLIILNKVHISEIFPGSWNESLILEAKKKKVELF